MKAIWSLLLLIVFLNNPCLSQTQSDDTIFIKNIPSDGVLLDKGWKFYPGDDPKYASLDFKEKGGEAVNPSLQLDQLPGVRRAGIGWFRIKLKVDSAWRDKAVGITLSQLGATEFYLNGESINRFGKVSSIYGEEKTVGIWRTAFNSKFGKNENQVLAVRYSYNQNNLYLKTGGLPYCLWIKIYPPNKNINEFSGFIKGNYTLAGIALTIDFIAALLTLFFFFSFPSRREYLYYGLYFVFCSLGNIVQANLADEGHAVWPSANIYMLIIYSSILFYMVANNFYLVGMYALLKINRTRFYWLIVSYGIIAITLAPILPAWSGVLPALFFPLTCFEILPIYFRAARKNFRGAWILFISTCIYLLTLIGVVMALIENDHVKLVQMMVYSVIMPALGLVIFLAGDFAKISFSLQSRIDEVEKLSKKTIAQEKEKQEILAAQKEKLEQEVEERTSELSKSLKDLKATQTQLIQSEKMASLGELTAGIAHEIQNPLNFVNNFSELNEELIDEMNKALEEKDLEAARNISNNVKQNLEKTVQHGKRADAIVKGMLQHSRSGAGQKEDTPINSLANEFLWLTYKGIRAKDALFSANIQTEFDDSIGTVNIIPQDIGRVLVNLYNNAFYVVREKEQQSLNGYEPSVTVTTKKGNGMFEISVKDNGTGIPENIRQKIFQPFFTTKPTGQGTGLGLSLSYDIIKAHGGEIKVQSEVGKGSDFIICLPLA
jgi:signal transduction histidine kinase